MDPVNSDSSSFTWTALNADDSAMFGPSGANEQDGTQTKAPGSGSNGGGGVGSGGSGSGTGVGGGTSPMQIIPTVANNTAQVSHAVLPILPLSSTAGTMTTRVSAALTSASPAPSSTPAAKPTTGPAPSSSGLSPSALASVSSVIASIAGPNPAHNGSSPSGAFHTGSPNSLADSSAEGTVPLRHNPPLLLLLILGCLVGAATVIGSLAWLCRASDSRKRAKKKARLNQSSWDPDASSSVFDGAGSSVVGAESSLLGGGAGAVRDGPPLMSGRARGVSGATGAAGAAGTAVGGGGGAPWWVLGDNDKCTASPSLMDHDFKSPNPYDQPSSRQSTWDRELAHHSQPTLQPSDFSRSVDSAFMPSSNPHALASSLLFGQDPGLSTPRNHQGGATTSYGRPSEQKSGFRLMSDDRHAGRAGTPVLSPLLKQILHPAPAFASGTVVRPGTPSSLLAGRPNHRTYAQI